MGAPKALQVAVSRLRRTLEPDRAPGQESSLLVTQPPGYELRLQRGQVDLHRFEDLVAAGRADLARGNPSRAADRLAAALDLWRGPPLADLAYEPFAQAETGRLEELRSSAIEERIEAELELGRHSELVAQLQELVGRQPLRERLREQLMVALYRAGRQADALAAYHDARRTLVEELGIEPGRRLRELHERILRQDPELDHGPPREPATAGDGAPEAPRGVFVGRARELAELHQGLEDALAGRGRLVMVAGEPGIGKSKLATELVRHAQAQGARVLVGRCWEAGGAPAYWPWVQSMRLYVRDADPEALREQLGLGAAQLAQLLPELHELYPDLPKPPDMESEGARFRLFEAVSAFLRSASQDRPLLLVLDDLHAADESSLLLLRFVAREMADSRLLVVCAYRDVDPTLKDPLSGTLAELAREGWTTRLGLEGLTETDVAEYVELSTGTEPASALVRTISAETEGNPLFVTEVVRLLESEGPLATEEASLRIPPGVRAVIGRRAARLSSPCRKLLLTASVLGRELELDVLAHLSELERDDLLDNLDEAMTERVMGVVPGSPGQLRFGHALIRDTLYDDLTPARRLQLHRQAGEALEAAHAADLDLHLTELAHHFAAAAPAGQAEKAVEYAGRAGDRAAAQLAYEEAARLYELALTLVDEPVERGALLLSLGRARVRAGDTPASKQGLPRGGGARGQQRRDAAAGAGGARIRGRGCGHYLGRLAGRRVPRPAARPCARGARRCGRQAAGPPAGPPGRRPAARRQLPARAKARAEHRSAGDRPPAGRPRHRCLRARELHPEPPFAPAHPQAARARDGAGGGRRASRGQGAPAARARRALRLAPRAGRCRRRASRARDHGSACAAAADPTDRLAPADRAGDDGPSRGPLCRCGGRARRGLREWPACVGVERRGGLRAPALRTPPGAGQAGGDRGSRPPFGGRIPDLPDLALRPGSTGRGAGPGGRGARDIRRAGGGRLLGAALRRGMACEHVRPGADRERARRRVRAPRLSTPGCSRTATVWR